MLGVTSAADRLQRGPGWLRPAAGKREAEFKPAAVRMFRQSADLPEGVTLLGDAVGCEAPHIIAPRRSQPTAAARIGARGKMKFSSTLQSMIDQTLGLGWLRATPSVYFKSS